MIKFIVLFVLIAAISAYWVPRSRVEWYEEQKACYSSTNVSSGDQYMIEQGLFPRNPGCYYYCIATAAGAYDDTTGFDMNRVFVQLSHSGWEIPIDNLKECMTPDKKNKDPCKWVASIAKCLWDNKLIKLKE